MHTTDHTEPAVQSAPASPQNEQNAAKCGDGSCRVYRSSSNFRLVPSVASNVKDGKTNAERSVDTLWSCGEAGTSPFRHYQLSLGIVGQPLCKFKCTRDLVTAVLDAVHSHSHAFNIAQVLHRDISAGNIILTDEGRGLLIDWELVKNVNEGGDRRHDRAGTWQFMSANLLQNPGKTHTFTDDLESFLHVLGWTTLRFVPAIDSYNARRRGKDMDMFDEHEETEEDDSEEGGYQKRLILCGDSYPSDTFDPQTRTPVIDVLMELSSAFKSLYAKRPPTVEDRKKVDVPLDCLDRKLVQLRCAIEQYDEDMERMQSSTWFIDTMKTALDEKEWPMDDKADEQLPIAFSRVTRRQVQNRTNQFQHTEPAGELESVAEQLEACGESDTGA